MGGRFADLAPPAGENQKRPYSKMGRVCRFGGARRVKEKEALLKNDQLIQNMKGEPWGEGL